MANDDRGPGLGKMAPDGGRIIGLAPNRHLRPNLLQWFLQSFYA
jgi:hypothetical protein